MLDHTRTRYMKIISDAEVFHRAQPVLMRELVSWLHSATGDLPMPQEKRRAFLEQLAFGVASIFDGKSELTIDGAKFVPLVAFADGEYEVVNVVDGTWLLDYVPEAVDAALGEGR